MTTFISIKGDKAFDVQVRDGESFYSFASERLSQRINAIQGK